MPRGNQVTDIPGQLAERLVRVAYRVRRECETAGDIVGPTLELFQVVHRHTKQLADNRGGQRICQIPDHVERVAARGTIEEIIDQLSDPQSELLDEAWRKPRSQRRTQ